MNLLLSPTTKPDTDPEGAKDNIPRQPAPPPSEEPEPAQASPRRAVWRLVIGIVTVCAVFVVAAAFLRWRTARPFPVQVIRPVLRTVTETVAATGRVAGYRETAVGAQDSGVITVLRVRSGDTVIQGQVIAQIENTVALARLAQARDTLATMRARQAETASRPRSSEMDAARSRVRQAGASVRQAEAAKRQAETALSQASATVRQAQARRNLAAKNRDRSQSLYRQGAVAAIEADKAALEFTATDADLSAAREGVKNARAGIEGARSGVDAAREDVRTAEAQRRTLQSGAKSETVTVASRQVQEAEKALRVARAQVRNSRVLAPFAGTITAILSEVGASVGPGSGIVRLVQTGTPEIRMDVDEGNLPDLRPGQRAIVTSSAYRKGRFEARVARIGAQVDAARGTVEVVITTPNAPNWIRPGQTLNVNIVTAEAARRQMIPANALRSDGDRRFVLLAVDGRAVRQIVLPGEIAGDQVTILEGLKGNESVIANPALAFAAGARVRIRPAATKAAAQ